MCSNRCMCNSNNDFNNNNYNTVSGGSYNSYNNAYGSGYSSNNYGASSNNNYGSAFVPVQPFTSIFSPAEGLANGTMFPQLVSPYCPNQSLETMNYLRYTSNGGGCCR